MNVYGHIFDGKQHELTSDLDDLLDRTRSKANSDSDMAARLDENGEADDG
jgi:hypothetical protein